MKNMIMIYEHYLCPICKINLSYLISCYNDMYIRILGTIPNEFMYPTMIFFPMTVLFRSICYLLAIS